MTGVDHEANDEPAGARAPLAHRARRYWPLLVVVAVALAIRLVGVLVWHPECTPSRIFARADLDSCYQLKGDAYHFRTVATNVAAGKGFQLTDYALNTAPVADHPPGYVLLLAAFDEVGLQTIGAHRVALSVLGALGCGLIGLLGWRIGGDRAPPGVAAGLLAAVYPGFWMNELYYMGESLFVPLVALTLLAAYRWWRRPTLASAALLGLAGGGAWLVRGESVLVLGGILVGGLLCMRSVAVRTRLAQAAVAGAVCVALMAPWVLYNLSRFDDGVLITRTGPAVALNSCDETWYGKGTGWYSYQCLRRYQATAAQGDGVASDKELRDQGLAYIRSHLGRLPVVMAVRVGREFGVYEVQDTFERNVVFEGRRRSYVEAFQWMYRLVVPLAVIGLIDMRRRRIPLSPVIGTVVAAAAGVALTFAIWRYRLAADVALVACAGVGIVAAVPLARQLWAWWQGRRTAGGSGPAPGTGGDAGPSGGPEDPTADQLAVAGS